MNDKILISDWHSGQISGSDFHIFLMQSLHVSEGTLKSVP